MKGIVKAKLHRWALPGQSARLSYAERDKFHASSPHLTRSCWSWAETT